MRGCKPCELRDLILPQNEIWGSDLWAEQVSRLFVEALKREHTGKDTWCTHCDKFWEKLVTCEEGDPHPIATGNVKPGELLMLRGPAMGARLYGMSPTGSVGGKADPRKTSRARISPDAVKKLGPGWLGSRNLAERAKRCIGQEDAVTIYLYEVTGMGAQAWSGWWGVSNDFGGNKIRADPPAEAIGIGSIPPTVADYCGFLSWGGTAGEVATRAWKYFGSYWQSDKKHAAPCAVILLNLVFSSYAGRVGSGDQVANRLPWPFSLGCRLFEVGGHMNSSASHYGVSWLGALLPAMVYDWVEFAHDAAAEEVNIWCLAHQAEVLDVDEVDILPTVLAMTENNAGLDDLLTSICIWCAVCTRYAFFESRRLGFRRAGKYAITIDPQGSIEKMERDLSDSQREILAKRDGIYWDLCSGKMGADEGRAKASEVTELLLVTGDLRNPKAVELRQWVLAHLGGLCEHCQASLEDTDPSMGLIRELC